MKNGTPLLTGTNGTYLYQCSRETDAGPDDVRGEAFGHFIVIGGYNSDDGTAAIADPLLDNPLHGTKYYRATIHRLIGAIFLGVGSDDGNLLLIKPKGWKKPQAGKSAQTGNKARAARAGKKPPARKKTQVRKKSPGGKKPAAKKPAGKKRR